MSWPNSQFRLLAMTSRTEGRLVRSTTSVFLTKSCQHRPLSRGSYVGNACERPPTSVDPPAEVSTSPNHTTKWTVYIQVWYKRRRSTLSPILLRLRLFSCSEIFSEALFLFCFVCYCFARRHAAGLSVCPGRSENEACDPARPYRSRACIIYVRVCNQ